MKIGIVGGGPAGLYLALFMKKLHPSNEIRLVELNSPDNTYGWGVVFSGRALSFMEDSDPDSYFDIKNSLESWDELVIVHKGQPVAIDGNTFSGIARIELLRILHEHCRRRGIDIRFEKRITTLDEFKGCDLIIGADGTCTIGRGRVPVIEGKTNWRYEGALNNKYQTEHDELFASIRAGKPINDGTRMAHTTLMAIMGRMAAYTGKEITWEQALGSQQDLMPKEFDWNKRIDEPPLAVPGLTEFI